MKKNFLICLLFLTIFSICLSSCISYPTKRIANQKKSGDPNLKNLNTNTLVTYIRQGNYTDDICTKKIEYPEFYGFSKLNTAIVDFINSNEAEFDDLLAANNEAMEAAGRKDPLHGNFFVNWKKSQMNGQYVSILIEIYYFAGGANGTEYVQSFNYDIKNDSFIKLQDAILIPQTLTEISSEVRKNLESEWNPSYDRTLSQMIADGTSAKDENFSVFTFDDSMITFWFQKYQVLPGSFGVVSSTIYR